MNRASAFALIAVFALGVSLDAFARGHSGSSRPYYGGGQHSNSHGGHYAGGSGSSHRGGSYVNPASGDQYGRHK